MTLSSFTQQPGSHQRHEVVTGRQTGKYFGNDNIDEVIYQYAAFYESSTKPYPTPGDHKVCLPYGRVVQKVLEDQPGKLRRFVTDYYGNPQVDLTVDDHISRYHNVDSYWPPNPGYDNAIDESITEALSDLAGQHAGLGADLAQGRKTVDELADVASRFARGLNALRRKRFEEAFNHFFHGAPGGGSFQGSISDWWLKYVYGIKPLMQDIHELSEIVVERIKKPLVVEGKGFGRSNFNVDFLYENWIYHKGSSKATARTVLRASVTNPWLRALNAADLINPASIAWELVPWSFAIDWFIPVGTFLQASTAGVGLEYLGGFTSTKTDCDMELKFKPNFTGYGYGYVESGRYFKKFHAFHRRCHPNLPLPRLYADVTPYSTPRALNAIALIAQLTK